jgi:zinc transporter, ZIP family
VTEAALWGLVGGSSLVIGAVLALVLAPAKRTIGLIMGFGVGVLMSAVAFELVEDAFHESDGSVAVAIGLGAGAIAFYAGDMWIDSHGGADRKRSDGRQNAGRSQSIVLGTVLDGIPESVVIGVSMIGGGGVSAAVVAAVFLSNVPEAMAATSGLSKARTPSWQIMRMWGSIALLSATAAAVGYGALAGGSDALIGAVQAFAAGAILTMLADTMMPEAFEEGGRSVGLATVIGFALAFGLSHH